MADVPSTVWIRLVAVAATTVLAGLVPLLSTHLEKAHNQQWMVWLHKTLAHSQQIHTYQSKAFHKLNLF